MTRPPIRLPPIAATLLALASCSAPARHGGAGPLSGSSASVGPPRVELLLRIAGDAPNGELGFRFDAPRDIDGDGSAEIAAGARFTALELPQIGTASVWRSDGGRELARFEGRAPDGLYGQAVAIGADVDGDGRRDVIASAPNGAYHGVQRGIVYARSSASGRLLWSAFGERDENLGWDLTLAGDQDGDGIDDVFVSSPVTEREGEGRVRLIGGRDGARLRELSSGERADQFGWYVARAGDLDGDGLVDLVAGAPAPARDGDPAFGAAYVFSSQSGEVLRRFAGDRAEGMFGEVVAGLGDLDGDGAPEIAVAAPFRSTRPQAEWDEGEVVVFSGKSGAALFRWRGRQAGERYGRVVAAAGDADGDGAPDVAIGAPWSGAAGRERAGRFEIRSGRDGRILAEVDGDRAEGWLGWHITEAQDLGAGRERGLVVSALRSEENGLAGAGALCVYAIRR